MVSRSLPRAVQVEAPGDLPHGPVRAPQARDLLAQQSPETLQFITLLQDIAGRLDRAERRLDDLPGQNPGMTLKDRQRALSAARKHVSATQGGRVPMSPADRIKAEVMVAWFLVGETHAADPG
jgi:hypothetical protein